MERRLVQAGGSLAVSATGYKLEIGPFPGWKTVPTW